MIPTFGRAVIRRFGGNVWDEEICGARFQTDPQARSISHLVCHSMLRGLAPRARKLNRSHHTL